MALFAFHLPLLRYLAVDLSMTNVYDLELPEIRCTTPITLYLDHNRMEGYQALIMAAYTSTVYPKAAINIELYEDMCAVAAEENDEDSEDVPGYWGCIASALLKRLRDHEVRMMAKSTGGPA